MGSWSDTSLGPSFFNVVLIRFQETDWDVSICLWGAMASAWKSSNSMGSPWSSWEEVGTLWEMFQGPGAMRRVSRLVLTCRTVIFFDHFDDFQRDPKAWLLWLLLSRVQTPHVDFQYGEQEYSKISPWQNGESARKYQKYYFSNRDHSLKLHIGKGRFVIFLTLTFSGRKTNGYWRNGEYQKRQIRRRTSRRTGRS